MARLLVIADDLSGACDVGVKFASKGVSILVANHMISGPPVWPADYEVVVVNTESRHLRPDEAAQRVRTCVEQAIENRVSHFYKKTDSALRGNIGSELEALMIASGCSVLPFMPSFPQLKRTTKDGFQYVNGRLLHETAFARDPLEPITESFIPAIIESQSGIQTTLVNTDQIALAQTSNFKNKGIYILDAVTDEDLRLAGRMLQANNLLAATAGSSGFAEFLSELLGFEKREQSRVPERGRMLAVCGSLNEVSLKQTVKGEAYGFGMVTLPQSMLLAADGANTALGRQFIQRIVELAKQQRDVVVSIETTDPSEQQREDGKQTYRLIVQNLGELTRQVLEQTGFKSLTVFGGDTLLAITRACGWDGLLPQHELLPGVVVSRVAGNANAPLLISKAGGFGSEDVLLQIKSLLGSAN